MDGNPLRFGRSCFSYADFYPFVQHEELLRQGAPGLPKAIHLTQLRMRANLRIGAHSLFNAENNAGGAGDTAPNEGLFLGEDAPSWGPSKRLVCGFCGRNGVLRSERPRADKERLSQ